MDIMNITDTTQLTKTAWYMNSLFRSVYSKIAVAIVILLVGLILGRILGKLTTKLLHEVEIDAIARRAGHVKFSLENGIGMFVTYFIYFIAVIMVLNQLGITTTVLSMLSGAIIVIILISAVLAIKDFIPNIFAGFYIYRHNTIKEGDRVRVKGMEGRVMSVSLFETKLQTKKGDLIHIPNSELTKTHIIKLSGKKKKS